MPDVGLCSCNHCTCPGPEHCGHSTQWDVVPRFLSTWMLCCGFFFPLRIFFSFSLLLWKTLKSWVVPQISSCWWWEAAGWGWSRAVPEISCGMECAGTMWLRCTLEEEAVEVNAKALCQTLATRERAGWRKILPQAPEPAGSCWAWTKAGLGD